MRPCVLSLLSGVALGMELAAIDRGQWIDAVVLAVMWGFMTGEVVRDLVEEGRRRFRR